MQSFEYFRRITNTDKKYIRKCLQLASKGFGKVSPNPMVGCVIVYHDEIIACGYHEKFGEAHAEVNAIRQVKDVSLLKEATVYVSLEPCSHFGKTPPCADLLIQSGVKSVKIGSLDPNPLVAGKGVEKLKNAGIQVEYGILESECYKLNKRFFTQMSKNRPYIILKWAESFDGFMSANEVKQISGLAAQTRLHKWRSEEDAFMVGTETLLKDNPALNTRLWKGKNPIRIAVDFELKSENKNLKFYDQTQESIILNGIKDSKFDNLEYIKIPDKSVNSIINGINQRKIGSLVVEGGPQLLRSFLDANLYDEIRILKSKNLKLYEGLPAPKIDFLPSETEDLIDDIYFHYE